MSWDLLVTGARLAGVPGVDDDSAVAIEEGRVAWVGLRRALPDAESTAAEVFDAGGRLVTPGLVDCHTHLVFGGDRAGEYERRLSGVSYEELARGGGGIMATVRATRAASEESLLASATERLAVLAKSGVTTVEIKSGYGLDVDTELRMLRVARQLGQSTGMRVVTTFLGAHTVPEEWAGRADDYIGFVVGTMLPAVAASGLADAVDVFCDRVAFGPEQAAAVLAAARVAGLPVKLHADQLSDSGGAALAARFGALSVDHLEHASDEGVAALAGSGTVAVLLPGAAYVLGETRRPPVAALRAAGVPMAVATDANPGTSPLLSLPLAMHLACRLFGLTPAEALAGASTHAAQALGLAGEVGRLAVGARADLVVWDVATPGELVYWLGRDLCRAVVRDGEVVS
ncbi:MAG TPA: imidazolonepropionase [Acidimicrobiales bacterium]|nr:imidazolonepropionase [Acidimicrobiales bacterium]